MPVLSRKVRKEGGGEVKATNKFFEWSYDETVDCLYVKFNRGVKHRVADTHEVVEDVMLDFDKYGNIIGLEVLNYKHPREGRKKVKK